MVIVGGLKRTVVISQDIVRDSCCVEQKKIVGCKAQRMLSRIV
jgi:hypothetical protein